MKMKKTIDMKVGGGKKTKTLEDGTVVTDSEEDDDEDYDPEYDDEDYGEEEEEFVPPVLVFKDSSLKDPEQPMQEEFKQQVMEVVPEEESPDVKEVEKIEEVKVELSQKPVKKQPQRI